MIPYNSVTAILLITASSAVIMALHVLSTFFSERIRRVSSSVNIALHALLIIPALLITDPEGVPIELDSVALFYMMSLAVYTVCYFLSDAMTQRRKRRSASSSKERRVGDDL